MKVIVFKPHTSIHDLRRLVADEINRGFLHFGCDSIILDAGSEYFVDDINKTMNNQNVDLMVTFGTEPLTFIQVEGVPLVNRFKIPVISFFVDVPYCFPDRFNDVANHIVTVFDESYLKNFFNLCMPDYQTRCTALLTHAGISAGVDLTTEQFEKRSNRLSYIASYIEKPIEKPWATINKKMVRELHEDVYNCMDDNTALDEAIIKVFDYNNINFGKELQKDMVTYIFQNVSWYDYAIYRNKMMDHLAENGYEVDIFGDGWEGKYDKYPNIQYKGSLHIVDTIKILNDYKVTLNPYITQHGTHERIFFALANGCQCITMGSTLFDKIFNGFKGVHGLSRKNYINDLDRKIKQALYKTDFNNVKKTNQYVLDNHMWKNRVEQMICLWEANSIQIVPTYK